jgi:hypothetical protein
MRSLFLLGTLAAALISSGCSSDDTSTDGTTTGTTTGDSAVDVYVDGVSKTTDSGLTIAVMAASPAPPDVGSNVWTMELADEAGAMVSGAEIVLEPEMPQHGHGANPSTYTGAERADEAGVYDFGGMNLIMPGAWTIHVRITPSGGTMEATEFTFDLEG